VAVIAACARRALWRTAFAATGGLRVAGRLPSQPCVLVANHSSHADTVALLAALPARRQPVAAAAADYWFGQPTRRFACRALTGAFPVRRTGGGSADLARAADLLAAGHDVIIYPEGTRSRDGSIGDFHSGAARLAGNAGVPLVPVGIAGTRELLPVHGRLRRTRITVHIGAPVTDLHAARAAVEELATVPASHRVRPDSRLRRRVAAFAASWFGACVIALWAFGEAIVLPLLPEFALVILGLAAPRKAVRLAVIGAAGSVAGGVAMYALAAHGLAVPAPLTTPRMHEVAETQIADVGAAALANQPLSGIPFKVYGAAAGHADTGLGPFVAASLPARALRIMAAGVLAGLAGTAIGRWRRWYPAIIALFITVFGAALAAVVHSWS
jgi:1-acyl-sn-glycerol-3-phosphate acyltransferase